MCDKITSSKNEATVGLFNQLDGLLANSFQRYLPELCTVCGMVLHALSTALSPQLFLALHRDTWLDSRFFFLSFLQKIAENSLQYCCRSFTNLLSYSISLFAFTFYESSLYFCLSKNMLLKTKKLPFRTILYYFFNLRNSFYVGQLTRTH